jgi:hypothetical protein
MNQQPEQRDRRVDHADQPPQPLHDREHANILELRAAPRFEESGTFPDTALKDGWRGNPYNSLISTVAR